MSNIQAYNTAGDYGAPLNSMEQFQDATDTDGIDDVSNNTVASNAALNPAGVAATDGVDQAASGSTCADGAKFDPNTGEACASSGCEAGAKFDPNTGAACPAAGGATDALANNVATNAMDPATNTMATNNVATDDVATDVAQFTDGPVEGFSLLRSNSDLLLRSLVFGCVFFILAHNETRMFVVNNINKCCSLKLKAKDDASLLVLMGLFVVSYFVLSKYIL